MRSCTRPCKSSATRISHRNTGKLLTDAVGVAVMNRVASDENLHHLFYRDLASAAIELAPSDMVRAIDRVVRNFTMPGTDIADFARHARTMAKAGVYSLAIHHDQILVPIVLQRWGLEADGGARRRRGARPRPSAALHRPARQGFAAARIGNARAQRERVGVDVSTGRCPSRI